MSIKTRSAAGAILALSALLGACNKASQTPAEHIMGEKVTVGPLVYNVVESGWHSQLGDGFQIRTPQQRFLEIRLSITNSGGSDASVPLLELENSNGQDYRESDNGEGVENWLGLLRNIAPAQTQEGEILFDVPLASYRLRLTDGAGPGLEKYDWVSIPLRIDVDTGVETPAPSVPSAK